MEDLFREFGLSASVLLSMLMIFFLFTENVYFSARRSAVFRDIVYGLLLAVAGLLVMATHLDLGHGVLLDARSILLGLVGAFFGWLPALITVVACVAFRLYEGGGGTLPGILIILSSVSLGLGWRKWQQGHPLHSTKAIEFYLLGLVIHLVMVVLMAALLPDVRAVFLTTLAPLVLLVYPLAFMALALLMRYRLRHELERAKLRSSEAQARKYMRAVEQCRVSIVFTDTEGRIEYVNPYFCQLTGFSSEEAVGQNPSILNSGLQPRRFYREMWSAIRAGRVWSGEFCNRRKDGTEYWESAVIAPVTDESGRIEKFVAVKHDITEQKEQSRMIGEALRAADAGNEAKAAFLSVISHELRTPLNHILGPCEFVAEELPEGELKQMTKTAANAAAHLTQLVQRILNFSDAGGDTGGKTLPIDDARLWMELAMQKHATTAKEQGCPLEMTVGEEIPESFLADETALSEILDALLDNALRYAAPGSVRVELKAGQAAGTLCLAVVDGGPQLDESQRKTLFEPFQQMDMSLRRVHGGIGLGLGLCRRYATRCGGTIEAKSDSGGGNRFEFVFPIRLVKEHEYCEST